MEASGRSSHKDVREEGDKSLSGHCVSFGARRNAKHVNMIVDYLSYMG